MQADRDGDYDFVVVGAGVNGSGIAQAAAAAGYSVLVLEKSTPAAGTSSKSSKLIHGGLRYLESYEFGMVREALRERALMLRLAPDLVKLRPFHIPIYQGTRRPPWMIRTGLTLYALLTGLRREARYHSVPRREWDSLDGLNQQGLRAVFRYQDAQTDDDQLTRAILASAVRLGAETVIPASFEAATLHADGCEVHYTEGETSRSCSAKILVNASGPWINRVLERVTPTQQRQNIQLLQGTHIVLPGEVRKGIYYVESPRDGRAIFVMPWKGHTLVGTTETAFHGNPDQVRPLMTEQRYLMRVLHRYFPRYPVQTTAILESFAGLRVLPAGKGHAFHRSREVWFATDRRRNPRLLNIYGGKLTSWRATAAKAMKTLAGSLPERQSRGDTTTIRLTPP